MRSDQDTASDMQDALFNIRAVLASRNFNTFDGNDVELLRAVANIISEDGTLINCGNMPESQEPKYGIKAGQLYNRESGEVIPSDEPVFIFRARDAIAHGTLCDYLERIALSDADDSHFEAVQIRSRDFKKFKREHPERMKIPD